jgi:DNA (cytosine-5)-methyltransferase 1
LAVEWDNNAVATFKLNFPGVPVYHGDIAKLSVDECLRLAGIAPGELDILDGSPPCSSFSTAGKREAGWGEVKKYSDKAQRTDDLFFEFIRFVRAIQPKVFVAENVSGLVKGTAKGYFIEIIREMKACGYNVKAQLLDAQWLGVPQARERIIFIGARADLAIEPVHPKPLPYRYSVRDALPGIGGIEHGNGSAHSSNRGDAVSPDRPLPTVNAGSKGSGPHQFAVTGRDGKRRSVDDPAPTIMTHNRKGTRSEMALLVEPETDISRQAIGREWDKLNPGEQSEKYFSLVRADAAAPSPTVTAAGGMNSGIACVTHPTEKRKFSIAELKRICGFPDDFALSGTYAQQWERMGRAVPPPMMAAIAGEIVKILAPGSPRTPGRAARSPGRSTTARPRRGAGPKRSARPSDPPTSSPGA